MYDWAEFRHFRYLLAILEEQGVRAAAEILHTAQPNLSVQARQFQENAAVRLFRRTRNGRIRPTEAGIAFMALARFLLETRDEIIDALIAIEHGTIGPARFGCSPFVDPGLFRTLCSMHKALLPSSSVRPTHGDTAQLAEEVANGAIDAALVTLPLMHPDLHIEEVRQDRLGALITLAGCILVSYPPVERIAWIALWPVALCESITGSGPRLGHGHEGTPVQLVAAIVGIGMAWTVYSSMFFFAESFRRRHVSGQR